jgi:hypothetical protein
MTKTTPPLPPRPDYLTAEALDVTLAEHKGLTVLRDDLASEDVRYVAGVVDQLCNSEVDRNGWRSLLFNMEDYHTATSCGTAHCLAGHLQARGVYRRNVSCGEQCSRALHHLFSPAKVDANRWDELTAQQAALAIDAFMTGAGEYCWLRALEQLPLADA